MISFEVTPAIMASTRQLGSEVDVGALLMPYLGRALMGVPMGRDAPGEPIRG